MNLGAMKTKIDLLRVLRSEEMEKRQGKKKLTSEWEIVWMDMDDCIHGAGIRKVEP